MTGKNSGIWRFGRKRSCPKELRVMTQGKRELEVGTLWLGNYKNNNTVDKY